MRKILSLLFALVLVFGLFGCSGSVDQEAAFDLEVYKSDVKSCVSSVSEAAVAFGNIAQYQNNYWANMNQMGSYPDSEKLVSAGFEWYEKETGVPFSDLTAQYESHSATYKDILLTEIDGKEAEEIEEFNYECKEEATTSLGSLFANIKL